MIKVYECWSLMDENGESQKDLTLELWGGSTKHPDSKFYFSDFKKSPFVDEEHQVFQWLLECASKLTFPFHAKELCEYALKNYVTWEKPRETQALIFGRPRSVVRPGIYYYTTWPQFCQGKFVKKLHKLFS